MKKIYIFRLFLSFLFLVNLRSNAQSTNPSPYCYPTASSMTGGTCTGSGGARGYGFCLESVKLNTLSQSGSCYGSSNTDVYRYWSATTTLGGGNTYSMTIAMPQSSSSFNVSSGAWIDYNQNNSFEANELLGSQIGSNLYGFTNNLAFFLPCSAKTGKTRMRVRAQYFKKINGADSCFVSGGFGETWDFDVTITQPTSVTAGFSMPSQAFVKTVIKAININQAGSGYLEHAWDFNNDGTWDQKGPNPNPSGSAVFTTVGTRTVKLRSTNCFGSDSASKSISIVNPTANPIVNFQACNRVIEIYDGLTLTDMSDNGPYIWSWNIYDSITYKNDVFDPISDESSGYVVYSNGTSKNSQNPKVDFYREGVYSVELKSTNGVGVSKVTKKGYIKVIGPRGYYLGFGSYGKKLDNRVESDNGILMDDGGANQKYGNRQGLSTKSYLIINPPVAKPITLNFAQVRLHNSGDTIKIYDDEYMNNSKLMGILTNSNNGTHPSYTSTTNRMYVYFKSDSAGTDSGYIAKYTNNGSFPGGPQDISIGHNILFVNGQSRFYNESENTYSFNYDKVWSVNDTIKSAYNNKDTFNYVFKYSGTQKVCLQMIGCDSTFKKCENLVFESGIMGRVFKDNNSNCVNDAGDKQMGNIHIKLYDSTLNQWSHYYTDSKGEYNFNKTTGKYKLVLDNTGLPFRTICPSPGLDSSFKLTNTVPLKSIDFDIACKPGYDLGVQSIWTNHVVFPGREHELNVSAGDLNKWFGLNCTSNLSGNMVITVSGKVSYQGPANNTLTPSNVSGKVFTYNISDFSAINNDSDFGLRFKVDSSASAGDTIHVRVKVTPVSGDNDTTNNTLDFMYRVRNSYDPNLKEVYPEEITQGYKDWLTYTVHFQNTGNAQAFDIRVADTLDTKLDMETFQLVNYSHPVTTTTKDNILSFMFKDIMLVDSTTNEKASHGFVQYRIKPKAGLPKGTVIKNTAYIYFDFNTPVVTNTVSNEFFPKGVLIPDVKFAAWLTSKYPGSMRKGNLMDTSSNDIKTATSLDVNGENIADLFGVQFFTSLTDLNCSNNQLSALPELPKKLNVLNCAKNNITGLSKLPSLLIELNCSENSLAVLPVLPNTVKVFNCEKNKLDSLPVLSVSLTDLNCASNKLVGLPMLPNKVVSINCNNNKINGLSALPSSLNELQCGNNQLTSLPVFPASLKTLNCGFNQIVELPVLPAGLNELYCNNNKIFYFEEFSESISAIDISNNSYKCLPNYITAMDVPTKATPICPKGVLIPDVNFATWLTIMYPGSMHKGNLMDTTSGEIKSATSVNIGSKGIADLFGIQFFTSLASLNCKGNQLITLPVLPQTVTQLNCSDNKITALPVLSVSLVDLVCENNLLDKLPSLPASLVYLNCSFNKLTSLPLLPAGLHQLYSNDNKITCFDKFSENITSINISTNNYKCLPNYIAAMDVTTKATPVCINGDIVNNPDGCAGIDKVAVNRLEIGELKVYPNPGTGLFNIDLPADMKGSELKIEIYNILGELVAVYNDFSADTMIDLTSNPSGIYTVKLSGNNTVLSKQIVKE